MPRSPDLSASPAVTIEVAAGILLDNDGSVLLTERIGDSPFAGLWEFPGGKINSGESPLQAMRRELHEELAIEVVACEHFLSVQHAYADRLVALEFFLVNRWRGEPAGCEGQALSWRHPSAIRAASLLPADAPVLAALRRRSGQDQF